MSDESLSFLLVHGANAGAWVWDFVGPRLARPFIAVDLPGHGSNTRPLCSVTVADCLAALDGAVRNADGKVIAVGHSMGAALLLPVLDRHSEKIIEFVSVAGVIPVSGQSVIAALDPIRRVLARLAFAFQRTTLIPPRPVIRYLLCNGASAMALEHAYRNTGAESARLMQEPIRWSGVLGVSGTTVITDHDRGPTPPAHQRRMVRRLGARVDMVHLPSSHCPMLDQPEELAGVLNLLLSRPGA